MDKIFEKKYSIELPKLNLGEQELVFEIDNDFFENFEFSPLDEGEIKVTAKIHKFNTHLDITFDLDGFIILECDRCTENYPHQFSGSHRVIYTHDEKSERNTDDVVLIDKNNPFLYIGQDLFDFIILEIPIRKVPLPTIHRCPPEILALISNAEEENGAEEESSDPRWDELKKLKDN